MQSDGTTSYRSRRCTGARLLHLELEVEARELGVAVPDHLTLDAQWDRDDAASGETSEWCLIIM